MLHSLYDYAVRQGLSIPAGFAKKTVKAYISVSSHSAYCDVVLGGGEAEICPDIGAAANGTKLCNVLVEKRSVVFPAESSEKSDFFQRSLRDAAAADQRLNACVSALENKENAALIQNRLDGLKIKPGDRIGFQVDGEAITRLEPVKLWWNTYRKKLVKEKDEKNARCLITGEQTVPVATTPPIQGLISVGGHGRGDALICFDKASFCSYGLKKAENAPVSEEAFAAVKSALDQLLEQAPRAIAGMRFVHWYDRELAPEQDPIAQSVDFFGLQVEEDEEDQEETETAAYEQRQKERDATHRADMLIESVTGPEADVELANVSYHILLLSGVTGRVMVRRYETGTYAELKRNLDAWHRDLSLTNAAGTGPIPGCKLNARLFKLLKRQDREMDIRKLIERLGKELSGDTPAILLSILTGSRLPDAVAIRSLQYIRSRMLGSSEEESPADVLRDVGRCCQWLKVWLIRSKQKGQVIMSTYNPDYESAAYQCGAMMAVYNAIQAEANPNVNATIMQRYYASAIQTPALVMGRLSQLSVHHLEKMENKWLAGKFEKQLAEISTRIPGAIPATLNLEKQAEFALGYYQRCAEISREKQARIAAKKNSPQPADEE